MTLGRLRGRFDHVTYLFPYRCIIAFCLFTFSSLSAWAQNSIEAQQKASPIEPSESQPAQLSVEEILRRTTGGSIPVGVQINSKHDDRQFLFESKPVLVALSIYLLGILLVLIFWQSKSPMTIPQSITIIAGVITVGLITLFPPWKYEAQAGERHCCQSGIVSFVLSPPQTWEYAIEDKELFHGIKGFFWCSTIDVSRYLVELSGSLICFGGLFLLFRTKKS